MSEIWVDIKGYENHYQISNEGRVRSLDRKVRYSNGKLANHDGRILENELTDNGYLRVTLSKNNSQRRFLVHRLVGKHFIANLENKPEINHINGITTDNKINNLEWCTKSENAIHAYKTGLMNQKGELNNGSKMTWNTVREARSMYAKGDAQKVIGERFNVSRSLIGLIVTNKIWKEVI